MESPVHLHPLQLFQPTMFLATPGRQPPPNCILNCIFLKSNYLLTSMAKISPGVKHHWREGGETYLASHMHYFSKGNQAETISPHHQQSLLRRTGSDRAASSPSWSAVKEREHSGELQRLLQIHTKDQEAQRNLLRACPHTLAIPFIFAMTKKSC